MVILIVYDNSFDCILWVHNSSRTMFFFFFFESFPENVVNILVLSGVINVAKNGEIDLRDIDFLKIVLPT